MSDPRKPDDLDGTDDGDTPVLEQNIAALLTRAHRPPRIADDARGRILATLQREAASSPEPQRVARRSAARSASSSRGGWRPGLVALAAAVLLCVVVAWWARSTPTPSTPQAPDLGPTDTHDEVADHSDASPADDDDGSALSDGSRLLLDQGAVALEVGPRRVRVESGRVLLDVVPGQGRFVVETPHGEVVVTGTRFALEVSGAETLATVLRGAVELVAQGGERATLGAGEQARLATDGPPVRLPPTRVSHHTSWARDVARTLDTHERAVVRRGNLIARLPTQQSHEVPLPMRALTVDVVVEDEMARVTLDQTFFNTSAMQLEGVYSFALPADAAVSRLAMYVDGQLMEAGIVERQRAREIYEDIVYRNRDPALLEWMQGNLVSVRIFPLPGRTEKRILLSYTQALERLYDTVRLEVPIPTLDAPLARAQFRVRLVGGADLEVVSSSHPRLAQRVEGRDRVLELDEEDALPGDDLVLSIRSTLAQPHLAEYVEDGHRYVQLRVQPEPGSGAAVSAAHTPRRWVVLHDTSASRGPVELAAQRFLAERFLQHADEGDLVQLVAFDSTVRVMPGGFQRIDALDLDAVSAFLARESRDRVGHTDLAAALASVTALLEGAGVLPGYEDHVLYLGDGIATALDGAGGALEAPALAELLGPGVRFVGVAVGEQVEARLLGGLAERTGGLFTTMNLGEDLDWRAFDLVATLSTPRVLGLTAELVGAKDAPLAEVTAYLSRRMLADGEALSLVARLPGDAPRPEAVLLRGTLEGQPWSRRVALPSQPDNPSAGYLPRHWARQRIAALIADDLDAHTEEVTALGMANFLLTPSTSLLVLENEAMYAQYEVVRGGDQRWAHYPAPLRIPVVSEPLQSASIAADAVLLRRRLPIFSVPVTSSRRSGYVRRDGVREPFAPTATRSSALVFEATKSELARSRKKTAFGRLAGDDLTHLAPMPTDDMFGSRGRGQGLSTSISAQSVPVRLDHGNYARPVASYPQAFHSLYDTRLNDLTEWAPAFFADPLDIAALEAPLEPQVRRGEVSAEARARISAAREAMAGRILRTADAPRPLFLQVGADGGSFVLERQLDTALVERLEVEASGRVVARYAELGLAVERSLATFVPWLLWREAPFLVPSAEDLAAHFDVTLEGNLLVLDALRDDSASRIELELDAQDRVIAVRNRAADGLVEDSIALTWAADGALTIVRGGDSSPLHLVPSDDPSPLAPPAAEEVVVRMPLRPPSHWQTLVNTLEPGSEAWRDAHVQWLAAYLAEDTMWSVSPALSPLVEHGKGLRLGEAVMAARGVQYLLKRERDAVLAAVGSNRLHAQLLRAAIAQGDGRMVDVEVPSGTPRSLVHMVALHRATLYAVDWSQNSRSKAFARVQAFARDYGGSPLLLVQLQLFSQRWMWEGARETAELWALVLDDPELGPRAALERVRAAYNHGKYAEAAELLDRELVPHLHAGHEAAIIDYVVPQALRLSGRGPQAWQWFFSSWERAVMQDPREKAVLNLMAGAHAASDVAAMLRIVGRVPQAMRAQRSFVAQASELLLEAGQAELAGALLEAHFEARGSDGVTAEDAPLLTIAANAALTQGRHDRAAALLRRRLAALADEAMPLDSLRADYALVLEIYQRGLLSTFRDDTREALVTEALEVASQWRAEDPDNAEIDQRCAALLTRVGRAEEGFRHLVSIIERAPFHGASYGAVASTLESEGDFERAYAMWTRAIALEPTDPTFLLGRARNRQAVGDHEAAKRDARTIQEKTWHDRFRSEVAEAQRMLAQQ